MSEMDSRAEPPEPGEDYDGGNYDLEERTREEYDFEAPEADAAEQHRTTGGESFRWAGEQEEAARVPAEADPADHADQVRSVDGDEDDYR